MSIQPYNRGIKPPPNQSPYSSKTGVDVESAGLEAVLNREAAQNSEPSQVPLASSSMATNTKEEQFSSQEEGDPEASMTIVSFSDGDPENPYNWSSRKKIFVLIVGIVSVLNSTLGSSLPSEAINYIAKYFHVTNEQQLVLPISLFLVGYVVGPVVFGSASEAYGRQIIMLGSFIFFTLFTMCCAVAHTWPAFLVFRLLCGFTASSAIAVVGGLYADIFADPVIRGRAMAVFMAATTAGPQLAPVISGFVSVVTWRWTFWVGLMVAGISLIFLAFLPETYGPTILKKRAKRMRKESGNPNIVAPIELEKKGVKQMLTVTLVRPLYMFATEAIVLFSCLYLSLAYAIFYLFYQAYPLIFQGVYHFNTGETGLAFLPIIVGAFGALGIFVFYDGVLQRAKRANKRWSSIEEYRRLPLACLGGPLYVVSLFWLGWSANKDVHWIVPILAGLPFGIAFLLVFMALLNYIVDAYEIYAASGFAAASFCRSIFGAVLPLAARRMYTTLGIAWASSMLGFLSLAMCAIPFAFLRYGDRLRANSSFCNELRARKAELAQKRDDERQKPSA
ncbi:hypothetical protein ACLMJK_002407 [Lecanora helva]